MLDNKTPAWLPLYLLFLIGGTLSPLWFYCAPQPWDFKLDALPTDLIQNTLLFVPLGIALRRRPVVAVACLVV